MNLINKMVGLKMIAWALLGSIAFSALASPTAPENGKEYQLVRAQPTGTKDKVEVTEFFFYTCPHCNVLDPYLSAWVKRKGNAISFKRVPVDFGQGQAALTKLYYTLEALGKLDALHAKIFEAIHSKRQPMNTDQQVLAFVTKNGIDKKQFEDMSKSFGVISKINSAKTLQTAYNIDSVPVIFVDGRYMTSPALVMGTNPGLTESQSAQVLMQVLDALVKKVEDERKHVKAPKVVKEPKDEKPPMAGKEPKSK
jgi:protein dithiol oxidoreductase (disulfide-forming)